MSLNKVMLIGNVGKDPEVRYLENNPSAQPGANPKVAQFPLATTERFRDRNGETRENTEWHNIVAWRGLADLAEKYIRKGSQIFIEGQIRTRSWTDQAGAKQYRTEVVANAIQLLGKKQDNPANQAVGGQTWSQPQNGPQAGYQQNAPAGFQAQQAVPAGFQAQQAAPAGFQAQQGGFQQQSAQPQPAAPEYPSSGEVMDDLPF